jgi:hypothetical protein
MGVILDSVSRMRMSGKKLNTKKFKYIILQNVSLSNNGEDGRVGCELILGLSLDSHLTNSCRWRQVYVSRPQVEFSRSNNY